MKKCQKCGGTGRVSTVIGEEPHFADEWSNADISVIMETCPKCNGSGQIIKSNPNIGGKEK